MQELLLYSNFMKNNICSKLAASPNTTYTAHFVRLNFGFAETSYMLGTFSEIVSKRQGEGMCISKNVIKKWLDMKKNV
jgi:hypothetical protein